MFAKEIKIGNRLVGENHPCMIVAELSGNHNGDYNRAIEIIHAAKEAGADAIKLQTYTADTITIDCDKPCFMTPGDGLWAGRTLHNLYEEAYTPWEWHEGLFAEAKKLGMEAFSSPFDFTAVDYLENLDVPVGIYNYVKEKVFIGEGVFFFSNDTVDYITIPILNVSGTVKEFADLPAFIDKICGNSACKISPGI